jgi:uncharacterized protein YkwD
MHLDPTIETTTGRATGFLAAMLLGLTATACFAQEVPIDVATISAQVLSETNAYRKTAAAPELKPNSKLEAAAAAYALYLAEHDGAGHSADGSTPMKRASAQGYKWCYVAENVWAGWRKPDEMMVDEVIRKSMMGWKTSPGHKANLLDKRTHDIGIGAAAWRQSDGRVVFRVVQLFGDECPGKERPAPTLSEVLNSIGETFRR